MKNINERHSDISFYRARIKFCQHLVNRLFKTINYLEKRNYDLVKENDKLKLLLNRSNVA